MPIDDNTEIWFGAWKGTKLANVPAEYLINLFDNGYAFGELREYIKDNYVVLTEEIEREENK